MSYRDLFEALNSQGIRYVVLRRYDRLPERTADGSTDVDLLVDPDQFQAAVSCGNALNFVPEDDSGPSRLRVYRMALKKPGRAIEQLVREPAESLKKILVGTESNYENPRHTSVQLHRDSQMIDLHNNLAYTSPMNDVKIPVAPSVTDGMLSRRQADDCFYTPTAADELAHLIPHCVFDKDGTFPPYYVDRCEELFTIVRSDDKKLQLFGDLLSQIFFSADEVVFELLVEGQYSEIRSELKKFSSY